MRQNSKHLDQNEITTLPMQTDKIQQDRLIFKANSEYMYFFKMFIFMTIFPYLLLHFQKFGSDLD